MLNYQRVTPKKSPLFDVPAVDKHPCWAEALGQHGQALWETQRGSRFGCGCGCFLMLYPGDVTKNFRWFMEKKRGI